MTPDGKIAPRSSNKLIGVPQIQRAILQATCDHTTFCLIEFGPCEVIESVEIRLLAPYMTGKLENQRLTQSRCRS